VVLPWASRWGIKELTTFNIRSQVKNLFMKAERKVKLKTTFSFALALLTLGLSGCISNDDTVLPAGIADLENLTVFPADAEPEQKIEFEEVARYGDTDDLYIGRISGVASDDKGNVYIADRTAARIHQYSRGGEYLRSIGGKGEGPGEFQSLVAPVVRDDMIHAIDFTQRRVSSFSLDDYSFISSASLEGGGFGSPQEVRPLSGDRYLVVNVIIDGDGESFRELSTLFLMDKDGEVIAEDLLEIEPSEMLLLPGENIGVIDPPYARRTIIHLTPDEEMVVLYTERVHISFYDLEGRYIRSYYHPFNNLALNRDELINRYENDILRSAYRRADMPDRMPAISSMHTDSEDRIWLGFVQPTGEELRNYWVLDSDGTKLAEFGWPSEIQIQFIKNGYLFSVEANESGAQEVVQYRFEFTF